MANFGNPMDYFQAGRAGGAARSPVSGVGNAIRGILEQSQKLGLIQAQASSNLISSAGAAQYKQNLETTNDALPKTYKVVNPNTGNITEVESTVGNKPIVGGGGLNMWNVLTPDSVPKDAMPPVGGGLKPSDISDEEAYRLYLESQKTGQ